MKNNYYFLNKKPIIGESFFSPMPKKYLLLEKKFAPLEQSIIWELNMLFWKYYSLWEKTYNEHFEKSLPSGISQSHEKNFIKKSSMKFFNYLCFLEKYKRLPEKIYVMEIGPGTGIYAKGFLDEIKRLSVINQKNFYKTLSYFVVDTSEQILKSCERFLIDHRHNIKIITLDQLEEEKMLYAHKFVFIRHSNMWGQLPCNIVKGNNSPTILLTRAVVDNDYVKFFENKTGDSFINEIKNLEKFIIKYPNFWKEFCRSLKLQTKWKTQIKYNFELPKKLEEEITVSKTVLNNIDLMINLINWDSNGYIEVVDYIARSNIQLDKKRRIAKFDGSLGYCVNGPLIKNYLRKKRKHVSFEKLKKLNTIVTIQKDSFENLLKNKTFVLISEIAARKEDSKEFILQKAHDVFSFQTDMLTFSDKAHAMPDFLPVEKLLEMNIFQELPGASLLSVFAMRRKIKKSLPKIIEKLKKQNIKNLIVVTGDPNPKGVNNIESGLNVMDGLKLLSKDFFTGATCYAKVSDIDRTEEKIKNGAKFFIIQSTFNTDEFNIWTEEIKRQGLYKKAAFIPSIIPLITMKTIDAVKAFPDIAVTENLYQKFASLIPDEVFNEGIILAKEMLKSYIDKKIFQGAYIYSKSPKVLGELIGFIQA